MKSAPPRSHGVQRERALHSSASRHVFLPAQKYLHDEAISGTMLLVSAVVALVWANSPWAAALIQLRQLPIIVTIGNFTIEEDLQHWINDGLMTIFFFVVSLEIKREILFGELSDRRKATLPVAAAIGGMLAPVAIFLSFTWGSAASRGWGVPMATDIAFAVGVLALLGNRVPSELRLFLLSFAIVDDLGSILVIAVFYTEDFSPVALGVAACCLAVMLAMRRGGFETGAIYLLPAVAFWGAMHESGIHATIAGVILAAITPAIARIDPGELPEAPDRAQIKHEDHETMQARLGQMEEQLRQSESPLERIERTVQPWVSFLVLPLFALANAGVALSWDLLRQAATAPVAQGLAAGLILGKCLGITGAAWLALRFGVAALPGNVGLRHILGTGLIGGIGFTVSIFISELAFNGRTGDEAKIAILAASALAAMLGYLYFRLLSHSPRPTGSRRA